MRRKLVLATFLLISLTGMFTLISRVEKVKAWTGTVYIRPNGDVDPYGAPVLRNGDNYTLTEDINSNVTDGADGIVIERNSVTLDGAGHTITGWSKWVSIGDSKTGLKLTGVGFVTIKNVTIRNFNSGILLNSSFDNSVSGNNIIDNGLGFILESSSGNTISGNVFVDNGLVVYGSYGNAVTGNTVNGKPLVYLENTSDQAVTAAGQVILVNCNRIQVQNLDLSNATVGLSLLKTNNTLVTGNNVTENLIGIWAYHSSNNTISANNIANSQTGISLSLSSDYNKITGNNIATCDYIAQLSGCSGNIFVGNNFLNNSGNFNTVWIDDPDVTASAWNASYPVGGNYWSNYAGPDEKSGPNQNQSGSDGIGDTQYYVISYGALYNIDYLPLMNPVVIPEFPSFLILPLFMIATPALVIVCRRKRPKAFRK